MADTIDSVLDFLENFRRPSAALWTGLTDDEGVWEGLKKGWYLEPGAKELADVLGIPEGQSDDAWAPWLAKEGGRLVANVLGDPLTYAFAPAKAAGIAKSGIGIGPAIKALGVPEGRSLAGLAASPVTSRIMQGVERSSLYKPLMHEVTSIPGVEELFNEVNRKGSMLPIREMANEIDPKVKVAMEAFNGKYSLLDLSTELQKPGTIPELSQIADMARPLQDLNTNIFDRRNTLLESMGLEKKKKIQSWTPKDFQEMKDFYGTEDISAINKIRSQEGLPLLPASPEIFVPRRLDDPSLRRIERLRQFNPANTEAGRTIYDWVDDAGNVIKTTKADDDAFMRYLQTADSPLPVRVHPQQATTKEAQSILSSKRFIENPVETLRIASEGQQGKVNFLEFVKGLEDKGLVQHYDMNSNEAIKDAIKMKDTPYLQGLGIDPSTMREVRLQKGLGQGWWADKAIANRLENLSGIDSSAVGQLLGKVLDTRVGQGASRVLDIWKRETLMNPGYFTGNAISNVGLLYNGGMELTEIPYYLFKAGGIQRSKVPLLRELDLRGLLRSGWSGTMESEAPLTSAAKEIVGDKLGGKQLKAGIEGWDKAKSKVFDVLGAKVEDNAKVAYVLKNLSEQGIDYTKLTKADFQRPEIAKALDNAVAASQDALINYTALTPTEQKMAFVFPFIAWQRGIGGQTLEQAVTRPDRFGRQARALDTVFEPVPQDEKSEMDPWMRENAPVLGAFGARNFGQDESGNEQMGMLARFLPQGNIEALTKRPAETVASWLNPLMKAPIELGLNRSQFKGGEIDKMATGFMGSLTAPLTGQPYDLAQGLTFGQEMPAGWDYALGQSPIGRHVRTANDLARGVGLFEDPSKPSSDPASAAMTLVTGSRFYGYDPDKYTAKRKREAREYKSRAKSSLKWAERMGDDARAEHYRDILSGIADEGTGFIEGF